MSTTVRDFTDDIEPLDEESDPPPVFDRKTLRELVEAAGRPSIKIVLNPEGQSAEITYLGVHPDRVAPILRDLANQFEAQLPATPAE